MQFRRHEALVVDLLRCREVQRLRRVRQLGFASFVFPGAEHSRFAHALGAAFLAARVGRHLESLAPELLPRHLRPDRYALRDFCVAALCHDLGHGPFSHVWETIVVGSEWNRKEWADALGLKRTDRIVLSGKWHEVVTQSILAWEDGQLHRLLEANEQGSSQRIRDLLPGDYHLRYFCPLINSDIDVDRCDFLLRDGLMAGLPFARFQLDRLIACLTFGFDGKNRCHVGLDATKGLHPALEVLKARSGLYEVLYLHKTVLGMQWLLAKLLGRLKDLFLDGKTEFRHTPMVEPVIEMLQGKALSVEKLVQIDDYAIWVLVRQITESPHLVGNDVTAMELANRLIERDPLRSVPIVGEKIADFVEEGLTAYEKLERAIAKNVTGEVKYFYKLDNPDYTILEENEAARTLLVHTGRSERGTSELGDHPLVRLMFPQQRVYLGLRLWVPREALDDVTRLLGGRD
jgi:uncharacterized protein